jgi:hypothetical protein
MAKTPEGEVQAYGAEQLKKHGCLVRKISYEGRRGCPDQLVLVPRRTLTVGRGGVVERLHDVIFIEYKKAEDIEPEEHQVREHRRMRAVGADVRVIGSKVQVDALIQELFPS